MLVEANNIVYGVDGALSFKKETLTIDRIRVRNDPRELVNSNATITGTADLTGMKLGNFRIEMAIDRLLVLSQATQAVNNTIYGDLVIATGANDLILRGPLSRPTLDGDVVVLGGNLQLPLSQAAKAAQTDALTYVDYSSWQKLMEHPYGPPSPFENATDTAAADTVAAGSLADQAAGIRSIVDTLRSRQVGNATPSIVDIMGLDLSLAINGALFVNADLSPIESLHAEIGDDGTPLFIRRAPGGVLDVTGRLVLKQGSEFTFLKKFEASGSVTFQQSLQNPQFQIDAVYKGRRTMQSQQTQEYQVMATVAGTIDRPQLTLDYSIGGRPSAADPESKERNAIALLLFGRTTEELAGAGGTNVSDLFTSVVGSGSSSWLTSLLGGAFSNGGFIRSFSLDFGENIGDLTNISRARLNVVSQFGKVMVRYSGEISSPSEGIFAVDIPLSLLNVATLNKWAFQIQRENQQLLTTGANTASLTPTTTWHFRLQYHTSW